MNLDNILTIIKNVIDICLVWAGLYFILKSIKNKNLMIVDVYKACRDEDYALLDKLYTMANKDSFVTLINLNYNSLYNLCLKTKEKILQCCACEDFSGDDIEKIFSSLKEYARDGQDVISYLYLYNFFGV